LHPSLTSVGKLTGIFRLSGLVIVSLTLVPMLLSFSLTEETDALDKDGTV
jgi:hypothetical protein